MTIAASIPNVDELKQAWNQTLPFEEQPHYLRFVDAFYTQFPFVDVSQRQKSDMIASLAGSWRSVREFDVSGTKVEVFNPSLKEHGWSCGRTVLTVLQRDMPFLVDSIRLELNRRELPIYVVKSTVYRVERNSEGTVHHFYTEDGPEDDAKGSKEAFVYFEIGIIPEEDERNALAENIRRVLEKVSVVVADYKTMLQKTSELQASIEKQIDRAASEYVSLREDADFINWLGQSHFTFLGYRELDLVNVGGESKLVEKNDERLGIFRLLDEPAADIDANDHTGVAHFYESKTAISFSMSSRRSDIHRSIYPNYIVVKRFSPDGKVIGEGRLIGFFTYSVYSHTPFEIPIVRKKVERIVGRSQWHPTSHDGKALRRIIEIFPRDELFQATEDELFETIMGVAGINERRVVRLFARLDPFENFVTAIAYVPRDIYNTRIRKKIENFVAAEIGAVEHEATTFFSESILARAYFVFRLSGKDIDQQKFANLEANVIELVRAWDDHFEHALIDAHGEAEGLRYFRKFRHAFPIAYQEMFDARETVQDIALMEQLRDSSDIAMNFFQSHNAGKRDLRFKVLRINQPIELSDIIPILENFGLRVLGEHPFSINFFDHDGRQSTVRMHDFSLHLASDVEMSITKLRPIFEEAFAAIWLNRAETDGFNHLVILAELNWREVVVLRTYAAYMKQTQFNFGHDYIADVLALHPKIAKLLISLFHARFDPTNSDTEAEEEIRNSILAELEGVRNLNEDRILRRYVDMISATLRTNFYQVNAEGEAADYLVIKLSPINIPDIPEPRLNFEIFVYSPRIEGVHLRGGKVARGGLRWSDRLQDYRTEILGLVKAQQVKNSVIVPSGAKGGFIAKQIPVNASRDEQFKQGVQCYQKFISGLLDVTDNYIDGKVVSPSNVVCKDDDDPYLVVAADKGTATFSDIANEISLAKQHWLGDAFASGGSQGYDHKAMGITARGAWVSVQRHFRERGLDVQTQDFTVIGIGDMSGDVFGNGMLLSGHICLVAAFNHLHIFVDPTPDAATSFKERKRLFELPRSSWTDYNKELISAGGGIFSRAEKSIAISAEMKKIFSIEHDKLAPHDLINALLKSPVDLIWNGGIGTYVKGEQESHADVGDKANDNLRVNGSELRCKVFGEGGNLGVTQLGRVDFCLSEGACNTDFIDNAAGVDCSDHEVNIKILLAELISAGDLTEKQRNILLEEMTDEVAELVLRNNYRQTQCLSYAESQVAVRSSEYRRLIHSLEDEGRLDRALEFLPDEETLGERNAQGQYLTRPELSVLLSYAKVMLKEEFLNAAIHQDPYIVQFVEGAFPNKLRQRYREQIYSHRLLPEIVATQVANDLINNLGINAVHRLVDSSSVNIFDIAKAYVVARDVFSFEDIQMLIESLDNKVPAKLQMEIFEITVRRVRRATRWFLKNRRNRLEPKQEVEAFKSKLVCIVNEIGNVLEGGAKDAWESRLNYFREFNLDESWCKWLAMPDNLFAGLGMVEAARVADSEVESALSVFYHLHGSLQTDWLATQISSVAVENIWQAKARESLLDELEIQIRRLAVAILGSCRSNEIAACINQNLPADHPSVQRWNELIAELKCVQRYDFAMFSVVNSELIGLASAVQKELEQ